jgi:hypothetical protein
VDESVKIAEAIGVQKDPVALKAAYSKFFNSVFVVPNAETGSVELHFVFGRGHFPHSSIRNGAHSQVTGSLVGALPVQTNLCRKSCG